MGMRIVSSRPVFLKQKNMLRVLYALAPIVFVSVYFFGWRALSVVLISAGICFLVEWLMADRRGGKVSYACFVTALLFGLSLPPTIPLWIAGVGATVGILFGKECFGGFGKNVFNPAIVGRAFIFVCFPQEMTGRFVPVFRGFPAGLSRWSYESGLGPRALDAVSAATPMWIQRNMGLTPDWLELLLGSIGAAVKAGGETVQVTAGSMGEVSSILIILSALYLLLTKTAQWRLMLSALCGAVLTNSAFRVLSGSSGYPGIPFTLLAGGFLFAAVFMVTDPVSAPKQKLSQWVYGAIIGGLIVLFRFKSLFSGGVGFAILLGNAVAPSLDLWVKRARVGTKDKRT